MRRKNGEYQLAVPRKLDREVIALNHDPIFAAHPGRKRTLEILCIRYYWPGMGQDVEYYFRECDERHRRNQGREYTAPLVEDRFAKHTALRTRTQHPIPRRQTTYE